MSPVEAPERPVAARKPAVRPAPQPARKKQSWKQRLASPMRWLHIYSSMFGLVAILFFSVTGLTLNHPDWTFGGTSKELVHEGTVSKKWLVPEKMGRLEIVEHMRKTHGVRGFVDEFTADDGEGFIAFKGPAYSADVYLDLETGAYEATERMEGIVAFMNDLHKGRDTGRPWAWVIDVSAILLIIVSVTGLALLLYIKRRRRKGLLSTLAGFAALAAVVWLCIP